MHGQGHGRGENRRHPCAREDPGNGAAITTNARATLHELPSNQIAKRNMSRLSAVGSRSPSTRCALLQLGHSRASGDPLPLKQPTTHDMPCGARTRTCSCTDTGPSTRTGNGKRTVSRTTLTAPPDPGDKTSSAAHTTPDASPAAISAVQRTPRSPPQRTPRGWWRRTNQGPSGAETQDPR